MIGLRRYPTAISYHSNLRNRFESDGSSRISRLLTRVISAAKPRLKHEGYQKTLSRGIPRASIPVRMDCQIHSDFCISYSTSVRGTLLGLYVLDSFPLKCRLILRLCVKSFPSNICRVLAALRLWISVKLPTLPSGDA